MALNEHEKEFAQILQTNGIEYEAQKIILHHQVIFARVDFYLPNEDLFCEIISTRQSLAPRAAKLRWLIKQGYEFTFYHHSGKKLLLTKAMLILLGLRHNLQIPTIEGLELDYATIAGSSFATPVMYKLYDGVV